MNPQASPQAVESTRRANLRAAEQQSSDLLRACPRCGDLLDATAVVCIECGTSLVEMVYGVMERLPRGTSR